MQKLPWTEIKASSTSFKHTKKDAKFLSAAIDDLNINKRLQFMIRFQKKANTECQFNLQNCFANESTIHATLVFATMRLSIFSRAFITVSCSIRLQSTGGRIDKLNISSADLRRSSLNVLQDSQSFAQGLAEFEQHVQDALLHDGSVWLCMVLMLVPDPFKLCSGCEDRHGNPYALNSAWEVAVLRLTSLQFGIDTPN